MNLKNEKDVSGDPQENKDETNLAQADPVTLTRLAKLLDKLSADLEKAQLRDYVNLMQHPLRMIWSNFVAGTARGMGLALGFTFFAATIVYFLQLLGALDLPIIGDYIADIVRIVQRQLEINPH